MSHVSAWVQSHRRCATALFAIALVTGSLSAPFSAPIAAASSGDWPQFHGDSAHDGYNTAETTISVGNVSQLQVAWTGTTGGVVSSSPVVADGVVYIGSNDGKLYAYPVGCAGGGGSCSPLWTATTGGAIGGVPSVADGVVYVGSADGNVYAFAVGCASGGATCTPIWTAPTNGISATPIVANGVVYVGSGDGNLYTFAVGCASGGGSCSPLWTAMTTPGNGIRGAALVANGVVYVSSMDSRFYAFDAAGVTNCSGSPKSCSPLWTADGGWFDTAAISNGKLYVDSVQSNSLDVFPPLCRTDGGTCSPIVTYAMGDYPNSTPAVANGVAYIGANDGKLYAFPADCTTGSCSPIWTAQAGSHVRSSPAVANGVVYIGGSVAGTISAFAVGCASGGATCSPLWTYQTGGYVNSSPAVSNGVVYVGSADGKLYAFGLPAAPSPLDHLVLTPTSSTITAGGSQAYTATGFDASGNNLGDVTSSTTFAISGAGSCADSSCTATAPGTYTVTATDGTATGTATLHVASQLVMGPQAMEGDLKLTPGAGGITLKVGYDFTIPGKHAAETVSVNGAYATFNYTCLSSAGKAIAGGGTIKATMTDSSYLDPSNSSAWYPSGVQSDPSVYQGSYTVLPGLCGSGNTVRLRAGGTFYAGVSSSGTDEINFRWHYSAADSSGGWSGTTSVIGS
jgi:outer membrane protein assembly factor BamB